MNLMGFLKALFAGRLVDMDLPVLPVFGEPTSFQNYLSLIEEEMDNGGRVDSQDPVYHRVDSSFFNVTTQSLFIGWLQNHGLSAKYDSKYWDCDDFALSYWAWCRILYARDNRGAAAPFIGYCKSSTINHVFNFAITERGLLFIEPQTGKIMGNPGGIYWMQF